MTIQTWFTPAVLVGGSCGEPAPGWEPARATKPGAEPRPGECLYPDVADLRITTEECPCPA